MGEFAIGDTVGDYEVIGALGVGGMGRVYKVRHTISDRIEAMKILLPDLTHQPDLAERFIREIKIQASLNHPNIASLHTALRANNQLLMVMEYVEGLALSDKMRSGIPLWDGVSYMTQVLAALVCAHGHGIVHRDIKPANIIITPTGNVKLLDFSIASTATSMSRLTMTGAVLGSIHYMSPEQVNSQPSDERSDLYSVGITLYEVVTGRHAIQGESEYAVMTGHLHQKPVAPHLVNPNVPSALSDIILKALAKSPADRFQKAEHFLQALQGVGRAVIVEAPATVTVTMPRSKDETAGHTPTPTPSGLAIEGWEPGALQRAAKELAGYIGPIAKLLVQRAAKQSTSVADLYSKLAEEIPSDADRKKFLASRRTS